MIHSPERQLWCAIIARAVDDALDRVSGVGGHVERARIRDDARRWFAQNDGDFRRACEAAGYDADFLRQRILGTREAAPARAAPAGLRLPIAVSSDSALFRNTLGSAPDRQIAEAPATACRTPRL